MRIRVLFFASFREAIGHRPEVTVDVPGTHETTLTVASLLDYLEHHLGESFAEARREHQRTSQLFFAVNQEYAHENTSLKEGDVVAIIPPVSGG